jgi:YVTN family beta-propeller protein
MKKLLIYGGILLFIAVLGYFFHNWARNHVDYMTATTDHPLRCASCHVYLSKNKMVQRMVNRQYLSPLNLTVTHDGKKLLVVAQESNALLIVDTESGKVLQKIEVGLHPHSVVVNNNDQIAYVSNQWADNVVSVDLASGTVTDTLPTANGPAGISLSADGNYLYVVNSYASNISIFDLQSREELTRLDAGNNPTGIRLSPDGSAAYVTSRRAHIAPYGEPVATEITVVNTSTRKTEEHRDIESAYLMENIAFTPSGDLALFTMIRPKNLIPTLQVDRGWMMTNGIGIIERKPDGRTIQLLIDEPNRYFADPFSIVITPDGKKAFVSSSGVNTISVLDVDSIRALIAGASPEMLHMYANYLGNSDRFVLKRIPTGPAPKGLALSPDGSKLYVAEQLNDRVAVISTDKMETVGSIDLGGPKRITEFRRGRRLFANAGGTFQNQYACYTCHPDEHEDGLIYNMASKDMGRNITNTMSLRNIGDTPPYKWTGKNQSVYKQDGMRFSTVLTRTEAFNYDDLDAISAFITRGIVNPPNLEYNRTGELTEQQLRGKKIFERTTTSKGEEIPVGNRCITCHPGPLYTNKGMAYVATLAATDDSMLFDTPGLYNLYLSAPYLHDGRAKTLEEIWTVYGQTEKHGVINDLLKEQLNDMIEYLRSIRDPRYENPAAQVEHASFIK